MAKDPAVLFYTSDFLAGVSFFTDEQTGQYIKLLCQQHQLGFIPKNHMITVCKSNDNPVMAKFMVDSEGNYYNERMRIESEKRAKYCASRSNNLSGRPKNKIIRLSYDNHMGPHMENDNENGDGNGGQKGVKGGKRGQNDRSKLAISPEFDQKVSFDNLWARYPRRDGRKEAERHFRATVTNLAQLEAITKALNNYIQHLSISRTDAKYIKKGSTWFNNWNDWENYEEPVSEVDVKEQIREAFGIRG